MLAVNICWIHRPSRGAHGPATFNGARLDRVISPLAALLLLLLAAIDGFPVSRSLAVMLGLGMLLFYKWCHYVSSLTRR
jgi:hypothetical protein